MKPTLQPPVGQPLSDPAKKRNIFDTRHLGHIAAISERIWLEKPAR
jgi:hypothetical protein